MLAVHDRSRSCSANRHHGESPASIRKYRIGLLARRWWLPSSLVSTTGSPDAAEDFDVVVVGSGFGASVVAYRLAEAGERVCVLERGRPYPPGSFPRDPRGLANNLWDPSTGMYGMFDIWAFKGIESVVSSGLGGGSLIYANVFIRKDEHWFVDEALPGGGYERWPIDRALLDPHYDAVEKMLDLQRYPFDVAPYNQTPKTIAMRDAAETLGLDWMLPELAVSFAARATPRYREYRCYEDHPNLHNLPRETCRLCGECDAGCNYGAKNTLDYTYLSRAKDHGAEIRTLSEVRRLEPFDGPGGGPSGYQVTYVTHHPDQDRMPVATSQLPTTTLKARRVVLGAGTFGITYMLLRNRAALPTVAGTRDEVLRQWRRALGDRGRPYTGRRTPPPPAPGSQHRPGHHQCHPDAGQTRRHWRHRPGLLCGGRRCPGVPRLGGRVGRGHQPGRPGGQFPGQAPGRAPERPPP